MKDSHIIEHEKNTLLYEKVGKWMTSHFKKKYSSLCEIKVEQSRPEKLKNLIFYGEIIMTVVSYHGESSYHGLPDLFEVDKTIQNLFGINVDKRERKFIWKKTYEL